MAAGFGTSMTDYLPKGHTVTGTYYADDTIRYEMLF